MPASRILVVRLGAMGDIVHALPAVAWLKQSHPDSLLTWLVEPRWAPLLEENPYVDRVVLLRRQSGSAPCPAHLAGGTALGSAARREPVRGPGSAAAPPELRRPGGNTPRTTRRALRFRGRFSGAFEIRHVCQRRASRSPLRF